MSLASRTVLCAAITIASSMPETHIGFEFPVLDAEGGNNGSNDSNGN